MYVIDTSMPIIIQRECHRCSKSYYNERVFTFHFFVKDENGNLFADNCKCIFYHKHTEKMAIKYFRETYNLCRKRLTFVRNPPPMFEE